MRGSKHWNGTKGRIEWIVSERRRRRRTQRKRWFQPMNLDVCLRNVMLCVMCVYIQELINQLNIKQTRTIAGTPKIRHEWHMIRNSPNFIFWIYLVSSILDSYVTHIIHVIEVGPLFSSGYRHTLYRVLQPVSQPLLMCFTVWQQQFELGTMGSRPNILHTHQM